jgi:hypothetical protein
VGRRNSKDARFDSMTQFGKRKYKKKNSPNGYKEGDWTQHLLKQLNKDQSE